MRLQQGQAERVAQAIFVEWYFQDAQHIAAQMEKINAIRIKGEVLTNTKESNCGTSWEANEADALEGYDTYLYGMDEVIDSIEKKRTADEAALKHCLAKGKP
jgi:hypothetical protein